MTIGRRGSLAGRLILLRRGGGHGGPGGAPVPAPPPPPPPPAVTLVTTTLGLDATRQTVNTGRGAYRWNVRTYGNDVLGITALDRYERLGWREIETSQGVCNWAPVDNILTAAQAAGGRAFFRFFAVSMFYSWPPFESSPHTEPAGPYTTGAPNQSAVPTAIAIPDYVRAQCNPWITPYIGISGEQLVVPDWNNEFFLTRVEAFIAAFGTRYANDERLLGAEVGFYGNFGEQHNIFYDSYYANNGSSNGNRAEITATNMARIFTAWKNALPNKWILTVPVSAMLVPGTSTRDFSTGATILDAAIASNPKLGFRCDSLGQTSVHDGIEQVLDAVQTKGVANGRTGNNLLRNRLKVVYNTGEYNGDLATGNSGNNFLNAMVDLTTWRLSSVPNAGWSNMYDAGAGAFRPDYGLQTYTQAERDAYLEQCRRVGFVLRTTQIQAPTWVAPGTALPITVTWKNEGTAAMVEQWTVVYRLQSTSGVVLRTATSTVDLRNLQPGGTLDDSITFDTTGLALDNACTISVRATHAGVTYAAPLQLVNAGTRAGDGSYALCQVAISASAPAQPSFTLPAAAALPAQPQDKGYTELVLTAATQQYNVPIAFGRPFAKGQFPGSAAITVGGSARDWNYQIDVKNRWPDNSVKFAIFSGYETMDAGTALTMRLTPVALGSNTLVVGNAPTDTQILDNFPSFDATIAISQPGGAQVGTVSARALLAAGKSTRWVDGQVRTTLVLADHTGKTGDIVWPADGNGNRIRYRPVFYVDFWHAVNRYQVRCVLENSDSTGIGTQTYDLVITVGGFQVYSKANFTHNYGTRWSKKYWSDGSQQTLSIKHGVGELARTKALENYDTTITIAESAITTKLNTWSAAAKDIGDNAMWTKAMAGTGGRPDLGPHPEWMIDALYDGRAGMWDAALGMADLAGGWPMNFRTGITGRLFDSVTSVDALGLPVTRDSHPSLWFFDNNNYLNGGFTIAADRMTIVGTASQTTLPTYNGWAPDTAHISNPYYIPYLVSGDPFYLHGLNFWASWCTCFTNPQDGWTSWTSWGSSGCGRSKSDAIMRGQPRGDARSGVVRALAGFINPDGSPEAAYFWRISEMQLRYLEGSRIGTKDASKPYADLRAWWVDKAAAGVNYGKEGANPLHFYDGQPDPGTFYRVSDQVSPTPSAGYKGASPWMYNIALHCLGLMRDLGYNAQEMLSWAAYNHIQLCTNGYTDPWASGTFAMPLSETVNKLWPTFNKGWNGVNWAAYTHPSSYADTTHGYQNIQRVAASFVFHEPGGAVNWAFVANNINPAAPYATTTPKLAINPRAANA